jgi:signal transduction histidine kinase
MASSDDGVQTESRISVLQVRSPDRSAPSVDEGAGVTAEPVEVVEEPSPGEVAEAGGPSVDCVVTEQCLDRSSGLAVLESVREEYPRLPVVVLTQGRNERVAERVLEADAAWQARIATLEESPAAFWNRVLSAVRRFRESARCRVEKQNKRLQILNGIVRHDIRNDVQVVLSAAGLARMHVDEEGEDHLDRIVEKTEHIADMTRSARDLMESVTAAGAETGTEASRELGPILDQEADDIRRNYPETTVSRKSAAGPTPVRGDAMLDSVFRNLFQNAVQHSEPPDVEVNISTEVRDDTVRVEVADTGPGVPDDQKERIFEYDEKGADSGGSGIGLFLVDALVDHYGGEIHVEDNDPEGSVFVVDLQHA